MSVDKLVDSAQLDADMTSVANAIRTKGGTSAQLAFPADFVSAIAAIPSGGGGASVADVLMGDFPSGAVSFKATANVPRGGIAGRDKITELTIDLTDGYVLSGYAVIDNEGTFNRLILLNPTSSPQSDRHGRYAITANKIKQIILRGKSMSFNSSGMRNNTELLVVDAEYFGHPNNIAAITSSEFYGASKFNVLILRQTYEVVTLSGVDAFTNTSFASGKAGGTLYVPNSMISSYQTASNWSTLLGYANNSIVKLEDSPYESLTWYQS